VARVTDKFAGPKQNGPDLERFRLEADAAVHPSISFCAGCKTCDVACPSGVNISAMNAKAKAEYVKLHGAPLRDQLLARVDLMGKAASIAPGVVNFFGGIKPIRILGEKLMGVSADMTLPQYASKTFYQLVKPRKIANSKQKVVYYPGCYVTYNTPEAGAALVEVLNHNGIEVAVESFKCCGLPLVANGLLDAARGNAESNVEKLIRYVDAGYQIVTSCPSCNLMLRREYQELLGLDNDKLSDNIIDVFELLQSLNDRGQLNTNFNEVAKTLGYHQPCHLKAAGCGVPSKDILALVPGLRVIDLDAGCCGVSGSYGFKKEKYKISQEIGQQVFNTVTQINPEGLTTECGTCQLQLHHGTGLPVTHPIQLLAESYGLNL
jgi:glycerol-3-phosphate dehydrogenase subunit C